MSIVRHLLVRFAAFALPACFALTGSTLTGGALTTERAAAAEAVTVIASPRASSLEQRAAGELKALLEKRFATEVTVTTKPPRGAAFFVFLGNPQTNDAIKSLFTKQWPEKLSSQGIVIRSVAGAGKKGLIVGGASPAATLWAVHELGHRLGVRYLLREDIYPDQASELALDDLNIVMEPALPSRTWQTLDGMPIGSAAWPLADQQQLLGQLAKLKFNRLLLTVQPWQPFVDYELRNVKKRTAQLWHGDPLAIPRDAPGRTALGNVKTFENSDFAGKQDYQAMTEAGVAHARGILAAAHERGMTVGISISPFEFPREFAKLLPGAVPSHNFPALLVSPGPQQSLDDPVVVELIATRIRACIKTYPNLDTLCLRLPEFPQWDAHAEEAWKRLAARIGDDAPELETLLKAAGERTLTATSKRGERALRANLVSLELLRKVLDDPKLLQRADGEQIELVISSIDPELAPYLDHILPANTATLNFIDYTARRVAEHRDYLARFPADKVPCRLIMTLADEQIGVLSQVSSQRLQTLVQELQEKQWDGFSTRNMLLAELDPAVHYLARSAWDPALTAEADQADLFTQITGKKAVADRLARGFRHIEQASELMDREDPRFALAAADMLLRHDRADPEPKWWSELTEHYTQAMIELYRSHGAADPRCRKRLFYWAKRSEYVLEYLATVKAVRAAAIAKKEGDLDGAIEQTEIAMEQLYNAIDTLSDVAHDPSDRALIAVLNANAYRPLLAHYEKLLEESEQ